VERPHVISDSCVLLLQGFRAAAEKQLEAASVHVSNDEKADNLEPLRKQVAIIYDQYLSEKVAANLVFLASIF